MSLPQEVKDAIVRLRAAIETEAIGDCNGLGIGSTSRRDEVVDSEVSLVAAIERAIAAARHEPVSDADKLAAAVKPWRELVERAVRTADRVPLQWYEDAKALLEKQA